MANRSKTAESVPTAETGDRAAPLLTMVEAAEMLRISRGKLYHLVWGGRLAPIRIGRRVLFTRASLDRLIEELQG